MPTRVFGWMLALLLLLGWPTRAAAQGTLTNGGSHPGTIGSPGDIDVWTIVANQGDQIELSVGERARIPDTGFVPWVLLYNTSNVLVAQHWGPLVGQVSYKAPLSGTYTVHIRSADAGNDAVGDYELTLAKIPGSFIVPGADHGGPMSNGDNHSGRIEIGDLDMWSFSADQGDSLIVTAGEVPVGSGTPDPGFVPWVRLYNPLGVLLAQHWGPLVGAVAATANLTGTYTVVVGTADAGGDATGDYILRLVRVPGAFVVPQNDHGGPLTNGGNHLGRIEIGDLDVWSFTANQGDALIVSAGEIPVGPSTPDPGFVPWIRLYNPLGVLVAQHWGSLVGIVDATANLTGTYTVVVGTADAGADATGDYLVRLGKIPGVYTVPPSDHGGPLTNGGNHPGRIEIGDFDIWSIGAAQGDALIVSAGEVPVSSGTPDPGFVPWVRLYDPNGVLRAQHWGPLVGVVEVKANLSGTYTAVVGTADAGADATGDYVVTVAKVPGAFTVPQNDHGGPLADNVSRPGRIEIGDVDMWTVGACAGSALTITADEVPVGSGVPDPGFVPWLRLYNPLGSLVAQHWGPVLAQITVTPTLSGTFTVVVGTADAGADATGDYTLRANGVCAPPVPVSLADSYTTPLNTPLVVPAPGVMANDLNVTGATTAVVSGVTTGTLSLNANGGFTYTPPNGFTGTATFQYRATNGGGAGNVATVAITVQAPPTAPTANDDGFTAQKDQPFTEPAPGVLVNDNANGGGPLTAFLVSPTSHGGISLNGNGSFTYTPNAGYSGTDTFTYRVSNANGFSNVASVTIQVTGTTTTFDPDNLYAWSIVGNTVTLRWDAPTSGTPTGYVMDGGVAPGAPLVSINTQQSLPVFVFSAPNGSFYVRVRAIVNGQPTGPTNEIRIDVNVPVAPSAPAGLTGMANGSGVTLSWRNTFGGGTPANAILDVSGTLSGSLSLGAVESFVYPALPAGTYTFSVRSQNAGGTSGSSNAVTLSFPQTCTGAPQAPEQFLAFNTGNQLNLLWDPPTSGPAPTHYILNVTGAVNANVPFNTRGLSLPVPPGSYTFTVAAVNACGASSATAPQTVTIP